MNRIRIGNYRNIPMESPSALWVCRTEGTESLVGFLLDVPWDSPSPRTKEFPWEYRTTRDFDGKPGHVWSDINYAYYK